jgi:predicted permease
MPNIGHDLRLVFRRLQKAPGFSLTVVLILALGIGATTAIFSLIEGVLLRPLPFSDPDRLVIVGDHLGGGSGISVTAREIGTYASATRAFSSLGGFIEAAYEMSGNATPEQVYGARLTAGVFPTLGVNPLLGRVFTQQEEDAHEPVAVISYSLWVNRYHRDPHVAGRSIVLDRRPYTILGVMPRNFAFPLETGQLDQAQLWVPMSLTAEEVSEQHAGFWGYHIVARLKDGVSLAQAARDTDRVAKQIMSELPPTVAAIRIRGDASLLREEDIEDVRPLLRILFLAVSVVLLLGCVNVAGLLLVRAIRRRRAYAVRLALGAGSRAVIFESVAEGLLLGLAGGLLGLGFAGIAIWTALHLLPESMPRINSISLDTTVVLFAVFLSLATGALCSLAPAFAALRTDLTASLKEDAHQSSGAASHSWMRSALVASEIAIAMVLLTACGAFVRSLEKMRAVNPGFRPDHVLVAGYQLPLGQYPTQSSVDAFSHAVIDRLKNKPGITSAGLTSFLPASGVFAKSGYTIEGQTADNWKLKFAAFAVTYGDYFRAMGIPLLAGRTFTNDDRANAPPVVIVNQSMAQHCWPGQSAIGKRMHPGGPQRGMPWATVVGVVADTKMGARDEPSDDQWYSAAEQPATLYGEKFTGILSDPAGGYITLRSELGAAQMTKTLRETVGEVDPLLAVNEIEPMEEVMASVEAPRRFNTDLISAFAGGALLLAITGIYAVVAFSVSLRTQEIAIRMALGAQRASIARLVLIPAAKMALLGCGLGVLGSLAVARLVGAFLFEVSATDPVIYLACAMIMMLMALAASALPAGRAAAANPMTALRAG